MFALEHSKAGYWFDFGVYGVGVVALAATTLLLAPPGEREWLALIAVSGLAAWSLIEYAMHRFVLHGMEPFRSWHARHHDRPTALISAPTVLSSTLIALLVFAPALLGAGIWPACALTLGVTAGYLGYAVAHHATHHWKTDSAWLKERKRWHAMHHRKADGGYYGVSTSVWDRVFGTGRR